MWVASFKKNPRRAKSLAFVLVLSCYVCMVNVNLSRRARAIEIERERNLSIALPNFGCELTAPEFIVAAGNTTKTLLASYPGSGKRFVYQLIEGLTNHAPGDDHELSFNGLDTLHIKTSYPHSEGVWSWGSRMDQMILLIRNPRWAIPSYHTMKFELLFSNNWYSSYLRIPFVYTHRPPVEDWDLWRDAYFESEMQNWLDFIDFWMEGGPNDGHCAPAGDLEDCHPQTVLDFDTFYTDHTSHEFTKLGKVLDAMENVDIIANYSRACIFEAVFNNNVPAAKMKLTHNSNRDGFGPAPSNKKFTSAQLLTMDQYLNSMIDKYSNEPWTDNTNAKDLVAILTAYVYEISFEYQFQLDMGIP